MRRGYPTRAGHRAGRQHGAAVGGRDVGWGADGPHTWFHAACRFFSAAVWDVDRMGLIVARLLVSRLLGPGEPGTVVIDDTLFKRWGRHVWHAHWTHDGAAQGGKKIARGNRWVVAGIVVRLGLG